MDASEREKQRNALLTNGQAVDLSTGKITTTQPAQVRQGRHVDPVAMARGVNNTTATTRGTSFAAKLLRDADTASNARAVIQSMLSQPEGGEGWRGLYAVPPGTGLEAVLSVFNVEFHPKLSHFSG